VLLIALVCGACQPNGGAPMNVIVRVANAAAQTGTFTWQTGGLFGTALLASTGNDPIGGCAIYMRTFGEQATKVTISSGDQVLRVDLGANPGFGTERDFVIGAQGISEVNPTALPSKPCG